jgi:uncharacterized cupin superfamily protein
MLIKVQGEFVWHQLQDTDELFLVIDGQLHIQLHNHHDVLLRPGERLVVPRGVRHCPAADQETRVLFLELRDPVDTGDADRVCAWSWSASRSVSRREGPDEGTGATDSGSMAPLWAWAIAIVVTNRLH